MGCWKNAMPARPPDNFASEQIPRKERIIIMKNMFHFVKKRGLSLLLALTMCMGMMPMSAFALEGEEGADPPAATETQLDTNEPMPDTDEGDGETKPEVNPQSDSSNAETQSDGGNLPEADEGSVVTRTDSADETEEVPEFPDNGTEAEKQEWYSKYVDRDKMSDTVDVQPGTVDGKDAATFPEKDSDGTEEGTPEETLGEGEGEGEGGAAEGTLSEGETPEETSSESENPVETPKDGPNWDVFYDSESDTYRLTYKIDEDALGDQTIDLTYAKELLGYYAQNARDNSQTVYDDATLKKIYDTGEYPDNLLQLVKEKLNWDKKTLETDLSYHF